MSAGTDASSSRVTSTLERVAHANLILRLDDQMRGLDIMAMKGYLLMRKQITRKEWKDFDGLPAIVNCLEKKMKITIGERDGYKVLINALKIIKKDALADEVEQHQKQFCTDGEADKADKGDSRGLQREYSLRKKTRPQRSQSAKATSDVRPKLKYGGAHTRVTSREDFKRLQTAQKEKTELREELNTTKKEKTELQEELDTTKKEKTELQEELNTTKKERAELREELNTTKKERTELQEQLDTTKKEKTELQEELDTTKKEKTELREELNTTKKEKTELQEELNTTKKEKTELQEELDTTKKEKAELREELDIIKKERAGLQEVVHSITMENRELQKELDTTKKGLQENQHESFYKDDDKDPAHADSPRIVRSLEEATRLVEKLERLNEEQKRNKSTSLTSKVFCKQNFAMAIVGEEGGRLFFPDGSMILHIPKRALRENTVIYAYKHISKDKNADPKGPIIHYGPMLHFGPRGIAFQENVTLSYRHCAIVEENSRLLAANKRTDEKSEWKKLPSRDVTVHKRTIDVELSSFSDVRIDNAGDEGIPKSMVAVFGSELPTEGERVLHTCLVDNDPGIIRATREDLEEQGIHSDMIQTLTFVVDPHKDVIFIPPHGAPLEPISPASGGHHKIKVGRSDGSIVIKQGEGTVATYNIPRPVEARDLCENEGLELFDGGIGEGGR